MVGALFVIFFGGGIIYLLATWRDHSATEKLLLDQHQTGRTKTP